MRKYMVVYRSVVMEHLQYGAQIAVGFISYFIIIFIQIYLWNYMYGESGALIAGYTKQQMIWYVMITEIIWFGTRTTTVTKQAAGDIKNGNIAYMINKPYHYALYILTKYTGEWSIRLPIYAALAGCMGMLMVGGLSGFRPAALIAALPVMILGVTINGVFKLSISLISFWTEDSNPFQWLYDKLLLVIGTIFPLEVFPVPLQPLFKMTPIYTVCYGPAKLLVDFSREKYIEILLAQALYLACGLGVVLLLYNRGVKKLYVNGG